MKEFFTKKDIYACIIIGDEILDAHVQECNLSVLINALYPKGYKLQEVRIVSDELHAITTTISEIRKQYNFVVTIGGLGSTHDDRTMEAFAKSFEQPLHLHEEMLNFFHKKPRETKEAQEAVIKMSTFAQNTEIIQLDDTWPIIKIDNCFALPGLPSICKKTIKKLAHILPNQNTIFYFECYVNIREHEYASWLENFSKEWTNIAIGSYPIEEKIGITSKISVTGKDEVATNTCYNKIVSYMKQKNALITQS